MSTLKPAALDKEQSAAYCALSESTLEKLVREKNFPQPRVLSDRRVGYLVRELDEWLEARPVANLLPPANTAALAEAKKLAEQQGEPAAYINNDALRLVKEVGITTTQITRDKPDPRRSSQTAVYTHPDRVKAVPDAAKPDLFEQMGLGSTPNFPEVLHEAK